ncbi:MAG: ABC transporter substrate-binding protein [Pseudomonadota bacterium]
MKRLLHALGLAAATALVASPLLARTPDNALVMAKNIDDIISLDPAQVFEFTGGEVIANIYDRITMYEPEDLTTLVGGVAESWAFSEDGKTITLTLRPGLSFHSGNPVTAEDVAWSLQRVVKLDQAPSFILTQFGWTPDNVDELVKANDDGTVQVTITEDFSPNLVLNALSAGVGSVVDKKTAMSHEKDGDLGHDWLKTNSAGSGAYQLRSWKANESVVLEANPSYRHGEPKMKRVVMRHVPEPAPQRLLLEKGDVDMARDLTADQIAGIQGKEGIVVEAYPAGLLQYVATNDRHEILGNPKVAEALRYLIDYDGMADTFLKGTWKVHQAFWPSGMWASLDDKPYKLDVAKAKTLLAEAGYPDGFEVTLDAFNTSPYQEMAQSVQDTMGRAGIKVTILPAEKKAVYTKHRARQHELILSGWSPDYADPHSNADAFASNPDNSDEAKLTGVLAWRNGWEMPDITAETAKARTELDLETRKNMYLDLQRKVQARGPFNIMFQQVNQVAKRDNVDGFVAGPLFDQTYYRNVTK